MPRIVFNYLRVLPILLLICAAGVFISAPGHSDNSVAEEIISLDLTDQPLGEVLDQIAEATGYRFILDESWDNFLVSASFKNEPLHKGLKRILRNLNNAIIYSSDRTIKIILYDEVKTPQIPASHSMERISSEEPVNKFSSFPKKPILLQIPRETQGDSSVEDDSQSTDENNPLAKEPEETAVEIEEQDENEPGGSAKENTENEEAEQNEDGSGDAEESPAQTESAGN